VEKLEQQEHACMLLEYKLQQLDQLIKEGLIEAAALQEKRSQYELELHTARELWAAAQAEEQKAARR
jgi:hypothetical protein